MNTVEALQNADCHHEGFVMCIVQLLTLVELGGKIQKLWEENYLQKDILLVLV